MSTLNERELQTGALFGNLFAAYDDEAFKHSVSMFANRFRQNHFDVDWFRGKTCLDAGCGGGRYSIALAQLGAARVVGVDISAEGIEDARRRAADLSCQNVRFEEASSESLPFDDDQFDCVIHSGVLMHTKAPLQVVKELARVLRPGGMLYGLVYATEGLRWPLVQMLRPIAQTIGFAAMDKAVELAGLPVNRRRTYLDDLFVPYIDFYTWQCLQGILSEEGFTDITRWSSGRLDHEEDMQSYARDLRGFLEVFDAVSKSFRQSGDQCAELAKFGQGLCVAVTGYADHLANEVQLTRLDSLQARGLAIGQGHHRFVAWKE